MEFLECALQIRQVSITSNKPFLSKARYQSWNLRVNSVIVRPERALDFMTSGGGASVAVHLDVIVLCQSLSG